MKKRFTVISILALAILGIVMFININYLVKPKFLKDGGFNRNVKNHKVLLISKAKLPNTTSEILGVFKGKTLIYDYDTKSMLIINSNYEIDSINKIDLSRFKPKDIQLNSRSEELNVFSSDLGKVFIINSNNFLFKKEIEISKNFTRATKLNNDILLVESVDFKPKINLYKIDKNNDVILKNTVYSFDGSTLEEDGILKNNGLDHFVYLSSFKNKTYTIDTFGLVLNHKTIDTIAKGPKSLIYYEKGFRYLSYAQPPRITNENLEVLDNYSIVTSSVKSDNIFSEKSLILDIYDKKHNYINSLVVKYNDLSITKKPFSAYLDKDTLLIISDNNFLVYKLS